MAERKDILSVNPKNENRKEPRPMPTNKTAFTTGLRDGLPIAAGYLAVAFSLGIVAKKAGLTPFQGFLSSILNHASAGEYAEFTVIMAGAPYLEMAFIILITNMRYLLMSCALSQKFDPAAPYSHRLLVGFGITDEIFGISIGKPGALNPFYTYGAMAIALPSWALGTAMGVVAGNVLPKSLVSALSVALYGMFIAIIIPAAKASRIVGGVVIVSFLASFIASRIPFLAGLSDSMKISLLTVLIAGAAAILFPIKEKDGTESSQDKRQNPEVTEHDA
ncbi:MAG: AzlC family ABC transporter permease [Lachnospiraceae bacterium]|nr:AzlC family ABC transporter permease [Lachnospiraceae bacterium]